jgi:hypothetical protein
MPLYDRAEAQASQAENLELTKLNRGRDQIQRRGRNGQRPSWFIDFDLAHSASKPRQIKNSLTHPYAKIWICPKN